MRRMLYLLPIMLQLQAADNTPLTLLPVGPADKEHHHPVLVAVHPNYLDHVVADQQQIHDNSNTHHISWCILTPQTESVQTIRAYFADKFTQCATQKKCAAEFDSLMGLESLNVLHSCAALFTFATVNNASKNAIYHLVIKKTDTPNNNSLGAFEYDLCKVVTRDSETCFSCENIVKCIPDSQSNSALTAAAELQQHKEHIHSLLQQGNYQEVFNTLSSPTQKVALMVVQNLPSPEEAKTKTANKCSLQ